MSGAKKLLAASKNISWSIDIELQYWWQIKLNVFGLTPCKVEAFASTQLVGSGYSRNQPYVPAKMTKLDTFASWLLRGLD